MKTLLPACLLPACLLPACLLPACLLPAVLLAATPPLRAQALSGAPGYPGYSPATGELLDGADAPAGYCFIVNRYAAPAPALAGPTEQELLRELQPLLEGGAPAVKTRDKAWFDHILADDYIHTNPAGEVTDKAHETADLLSPAAHSFALVEPVPLPYDRVRFFNGNTAVVTGQLRTKGTDHGQPFSGQVRTLATRVRRNGAWQLVAFQATPVAKRFEK